MTKSSKWSLSFRFPHQNPVSLSFLAQTWHMPYASCLTHLILIYIITQIISVEEYKTFSSSLCIFLQSTITSSLLQPISSSLFSNAFNLCSSINVGIVGWVRQWMLRFWAGMWCLAVGRLVSLFLLLPSPADWTLEDNVFVLGTDMHLPNYMALCPRRFNIILKEKVWMLCERQQRSLYCNLTRVLWPISCPCSYHEDKLGELRNSSTHS